MLAVSKKCVSLACSFLPLQTSVENWHTAARHYDSFPLPTNVFSFAFQPNPASQSKLKIPGDSRTAMVHFSQLELSKSTVKVLD